MEKKRQKIIDKIETLNIFQASIRKQLKSHEKKKRKVLRNLLKEKRDDSIKS